MARFEREPSEFIEKVVCTNRVSKTVKGGRVMKFSALMVVGDGKGRVGFGMGKAGEVSEAIRKGIEDAKKNMHTVTLTGTTIPHEVLGAFGAENVVSVGAQRGRHHRALAFVVFNKQNAKHSASSRLAGMESVYHILSKCGTPPNTIAVRKKR